jgi:hypothetical protein
MKTKSFLFACTVFTSLLSLHAADDEAGGPKGGRLLETEPLKAEFFVTADRKAEVTFYDASMKPIVPTTQTVAITAEAASGRVQLEMEKSPTGFISKNALPEGDPYRVVVQVRTAADVKPQNFRINLQMHICGECARAEYACTCGH